MANLLTALMQSLGSAPPGVDQAPPPPANWQEMVDPNVYTQPTAGPQLAPEPQAPPAVYEGPPIGVSGKDPIRNKGMFGVKGTLRDILGVLGDGLTGRNNYSQLRQQEKFGNILAGKYEDNMEESFAQNPMLAIQRLAEEGYGKEAADLLQQVQANEIANRRVSAQEARETRTAAAQIPAAVQKTIGVVSSLLSNVRSDAEYQRIRGTAANFLRNTGKELGNEDLIDLANTLPVSYEDSLNRWGIQQYQSNRLDDFDADRSSREGIASERVGATIRGQDVSASTQRRGQDIRSADTRRGQDLRGTKKGKAPTSGNSPMADIPSMIPPAPRKPGDRIVGPNGMTLVSPDGKRWTTPKQ